MNPIEIYSEFTAKKQELIDSCNFLPDMSSKDGYEASKRVALDVRKIAKAADKKRLEAKKEAMQVADAIHEAGKSIVDELECAAQPHYNAYREHDAEIKRKKEEEIKRVDLAIQAINEMPLNAYGLNSTELKNLIENCSNVNIEYGNRTIEAGQARDNSLFKLNELLANAIAQEAQAEELRKQQEELERIQEEQRKAQAIIDEQNRIEAEKQAQERAKLEEEKRKQEEAERIRQAEIAAQEAERKRIEQEELERKQEEERRAANKAHRKLINNAALKDLMNAEFSEEDGKRIIELIAQGKISNITINY